MTSILEFFDKLIEIYGETTALVIMSAVIIIYAVHLITKNNSLILKRHIEQEESIKEKSHAKAAAYRKDITPKIRKELSQLAGEVHADRALLFEFSNGTSNIIGLPFLYATATAEVVASGVSPVASQYQRINISLITDFLEKLEDKGYYYIEDLKNYESDYPILFNYMGPNGVNTALFYTVCGLKDILGFIVVTTVGDNKFTREEALPRVAESAQIISSLLNFEKLLDTK